MSARKRSVRAALHREVTLRDNTCCRVCGAINRPLECHHITPGPLLPHDGLVAENLIALCPACHQLAEAWLNQHPSYPDIRMLGTSDPYHPTRLYALIGSSYSVALAACGAL